MNNISKLSGLGHYSFANPPTIYDEEALTALELCARTAAKVNETVEHVNNVHEALVNEHNAHETAVDQRQTAHETAVDQRQTAHETAVDQRINDQDKEIDEAREYMETNIEETTRTILDEKVNAGLFDTLTQQGYAEVTANLPKYTSMYAHIGKQDANIPASLQVGFQYAIFTNIYFPAGTYYINGTLSPNAGVTFFGDGPGKTKLIFTGTGPMFNDKNSGYEKPLTIANMEISNDNGASFISAGKTGWGGCVRVHNCRITGFSGGVATLKSTFTPIFENCVINSPGSITFDTIDGTETETNFNNCAVFRNVYFNGTYGNNRAAALFVLKNVRDITFDKCQLEHCTTIFNMIGKVTDLHAHHCWFEDVDSLYTDGGLGTVPELHGCRLVNVSKYDSTATGLDRVPGYDSIKYHGTETNTYTALANGDEIVFEGPYVTNNSDNWSTNFRPYKISTKGATFNVPFNTLYLSDDTPNGGQTALQDPTLESVLRNTQCSAIVEATAICTYADGTLCMLTAKGLWRNNTLNFEPARIIYRDSGGTAGTAAPSITQGKVKNCVARVDAGAGCKKIELITEWRVYK